MCDNVVRTTQDLAEAINSYESMILKQANDVGGACSLLEFNLPSSTMASGQLLRNSTETVDYLSDIFSNSNVSESLDILQPVSVELSSGEHNKKDSRSDNASCLRDIDVLGEHLLKENLQSSNFRHQGKVPMNLLEKCPTPCPQEQPKSADVNLGLDLRFLIDKRSEKTEPIKNITPDYSKDDCLVDIREDKSKEDKKNTDIKLNDLYLKLEDIRPSSVKPATLLDDKKGITVNLYLAKEKPKDGVLVYVMTTINKNKMGLSNYLFQAVVPKGFKIKIQQPSSDSLPPFNPFLPSSAITHVIFLWNARNENLSLKFMISYVMDEEMVTEMGEVDQLPMDNS